MAGPIGAVRRRERRCLRRPHHGARSSWRGNRRAGHRRGVLCSAGACCRRDRVAAAPGQRRADVPAARGAGRRAARQGHHPGERFPRRHPRALYRPQGAAHGGRGAMTDRTKRGTVMLSRWLLAFALALIWPASAQQIITSQKSVSPYTAPNVTLVCGADGTTAVQAAINATSTNGGAVALPPCAKASPIVISSTLLVPDNVSVLGTGRSVTWLQAAASLNAPIFENSNFAGGASIILNSNIEIGFLSIAGNGANQTHPLANPSIYMLAFAPPAIHR